MSIKKYAIALTIFPFLSLAGCFGTTTTQVRVENIESSQPPTRATAIVTGNKNKGLNWAKADGDAKAVVSGNSGDSSNLAFADGISENNPNEIVDGEQYTATAEIIEGRGTIEAGVLPLDDFNFTAGGWNLRSRGYVGIPVASEEKLSATQN